jgi:hypothetical protein
VTVTSPNPFQADGIGKYHFYAPAGRYVVQISGPQISGALTYPDVILAADSSSSGSGHNISAFELTLGGNLTVAGNASISGTLSSTSFNPGTLTSSTLGIAANYTPKPGHQTAAMFGLSGDSPVDWAAKVPFLQKEIPALDHTAGA